MAVRSTSGVRIGFLRPATVERAFMILLYLVLLLLVILSVLGTFYGRRGEDAPIGAPLRILADVFGDPEVGVPSDPAGLGLAISIQAVLTIIQYGARQKARTDRRWWLLYLVALGFSVYYNWQAYWTPLTALIPWYLAGPGILAGDILPEFLAVRRE